MSNDQTDTYLTIQGLVEAEIVEKKSRFISHLSHVENEDEALEFLNRIRKENAQARHNVYAYVLHGGRIRYSDDGEPAQTSGLPTLEVLKGAKLENVICVTTRYFGGVLLGTGGLVRAYTKAAQTAISLACVEKITTCIDMNLEMDYSTYSSLSKFFTRKDLRVKGSDFSDKVDVAIRVDQKDFATIEKALIEATNGKIVMSSSEPFEAAL